MLVLASASPRRRELLTQAGFTFEVHPAHIPEDPYPDEDPVAYVSRLAREKAQAVYDEITNNFMGEERASAPPPVVLGADKWLQVIDPIWYGGTRAARDEEVFWLSTRPMTASAGA